MTRSNRHISEGRRGDLGAGVSRAGGGTALIMLAGTLPEEYKYLEPFVTFCAPTVAVAVTAVYAWLTRKWRRWNLNAAREGLLLEVELALSNPSLSEERTKYYQDKRKKIEEMQDKMFEERIDRLDQGLTRLSSG